MAKYGSSLAEVKVYINGKEQAKKELEELKAVAKEYKDQMTLANNAMLEAADKMAEARERANKYSGNKDSAEYKAAVDDELRAQKAHDDAQKRFKENQTEHKKYQRLINESKKLTVDLEHAMSHLSEQDIKHLRLLQRQLDAIRNQIDPKMDKDGTFLAYVNNAIKTVADTIKNRKGELVEFEDIIGKITHVDDRTLEGVIKRLKDLIATTDKLEIEKLKKYKDELAQAEEVQKIRIFNEGQSIIRGNYTHTIEGTKQAIELLKKYQETLDATDADSINLVNEAIREMNTELDAAAKKSARETLTTNLKTSGTEDIKKAVEWLTKYQGTLEPLSQEWREINKEIEAGNDRLKAVSDRTKLDAMTDQFRNLNKLSTAALADQQKYWQSVLDNAQKGTAAYIQAERKLQAISQETTTRREAQAGTVMGNLAKHSVAEIQEAIKMTEQLRDAQKAGSAEYEIYNSEIKQAKEYLQSFIDLNKQADMEDKWSNLATLSANALAEQKKYWQEMVNGAKQGSQELQDYQDKLKAVVEEEQFRLDNKYIKVMNNPDQYSVRELEEAIKHFEKLRDEQRLGSGEWDYYASMVNRASEKLKAFKDGTKLDVMEKQFADLSNLSVNAFAEQKKYWQGLRDSLEATDPLYTKAIDNLKQITDLENSRIKTDATQTIFDVKSGNWDKTIEKTQQAIKLIEEYKKQLKTKSDADAIDDANKAIAELNANLGKAKEALMSVNEAINIGTQIKEGTFDGTTEEILRAKKALEEYRKTLKLKTDADTIKDVDEALRNVSSAAEQANRKLIDINDVLDRLDTASVEELEAAAKQLQEQLEGAAREGRNYGETAAKLREVNLELKKAKKEWEGQENVIARTAKRLMAYVAVYGGFNFIKDKITEAIHANLELSDSFADIQKTTGLAAEEVKNLSRDIDAIDTRTSQQQLHELAATAGQIGLKSKEDVLGFVKASNMITVSLNELGSEGTASLMKIAQLTGEVTKDGVEKSLTAIGSAINELSANSAATAGPIVEFMKRMGGIAAQSGITSAEMAAIGATADAIGQSMEVTGTSMNKFVATLMSNSDQVAYALNMDAKALNELLDGGKTMDAMLMVFERMNEMGGIEKLAPVMGDLGSEGARMTQMLSAMAKSVGFLRDQVDLSREAFKEATSIENEYNIKNENAIALLERMGNTLREMWVNSIFVTGLTWVLKQMNDFVKWLADGEAGARLLKTTMIALATTIALASMHLDSFCKALFKAKTYTELFSGAWSKLGKLLKANWISLLVGALVSLGYWLIQTLNHVSALTRATQEYHSELDKENNIMQSLFKGAQNENLAKEKRAKLISEINNRYGKYLGFMVSERDSVQELAAAYELANAKMRESMATRMSNKQMDILDEQFGERMTENRTDLMSTLSKGRYTAGREKEAMSIIRKITMGNLDKEVDDIRKLINEEFEKAFGKGSAFAATDIKNYIETQKEYYKEYETINQEAAEHLQQAQKDTADANVKMMNEMFKQVQDLNSGAIKESTEGPFKTALDIQRGIVQEGKQYIAFAEEQMKNMTEEQKVEVQKNIKLVETQIEAARKNLPEGDAWGKELNLKSWKETLDNLNTASVDSLVSTYKELRDAPKLISDVIKYNRMFGTSFTSLSEVMEDSKNKAEQIKNQLASMGRTTTGDFLWGRSGGRDQKAKARQEFQAAMSALEAYYKEYEDFYRQQKEELGLTDETTNQQILDNDRKFNEDRQQLIKKFLGEESTFDSTKYIGKLSKHDYFGDKDLEEMSKQYQKWGDAMTDGGRNQIAKSGVAIREALNKEKRKVYDLLADKQYVQQATKEMQDAFEKLNVTDDRGSRLDNFLWGDTSMDNRTQEEANKRMAILMEFSEDVYSEEAETFKKRLLQDTTFGETVKKMDEEEYASFLVLLQQYHDKVISAEKRHADERKRIIDQQWEEEGYQSGYEAADRTIGIAESNLNTMQNAGAIANEQEFFDQYQQLVLNRVALEQWAYEQKKELYKKNNATQEQFQQLDLDHAKTQQDFQQKLLDNYIARYQKMADVTTSYGNIIGDGFGRMIAGEKDAGKQLIKNLLTETIQMASQFAQRLILQSTFGAQMESIRATQNAAQLSAAYATAMSEVGIEASKMAAIEAIAAGKITAQSMAQPDSIVTWGGAGAARAAVIIGLVSAATAAALALVNSLFPESKASETKNRKLSTGMLTYAEGNYPVLGNDGKVYDAKYEGAGMKTGVYGGGAHFGIFSEKQPEMIVDGKTTQKIILNYPYIYDAITTIAKNGRLKNAMPTFATGDYPAGMKQLAPIAEVDASTGSNEEMAQMRATMDRTNATIDRLSRLLENGISAHLDGLETHKQQKKNERFLKRRGID